MDEAEGLKTRFSNDPGEILSQPVEDFISASEVTSRIPFTEEDQQELYERIEASDPFGKHPIVHLVFQSTWTGAGIADSIPSNLKESERYQQLHILTPNQLASISEVPPHKAYLEAHPDAFVVVNTDGSIMENDRIKLQKTLMNSMGVIAGGGPGHPYDPIYAPVLKALESVANEGIPITGVCLGHELMGYMLTDKSSTGVVPHGYAVGTAVESSTDIGKQHEVISRLGDLATIVHVNEYEWKNPEKIPGVRPLMQNLKGEATALDLTLRYAAQAITIQGHPEFAIMGKGPGYTEDQKTVDFNGTQLVFPRGISMAYLGLVQYAILPRYEILQKQYGMDMEDIKELILPERIAAQHLGKDFYGPILKYMVDFRTKTF